jgi:hypothetical protein
MKTNNAQAVPIHCVSTQYNCLIDQRYSKVRKELCLWCVILVTEIMLVFIARFCDIWLFRIKYYGKVIHNC